MFLDQSYSSVAERRRKTQETRSFSTCRNVGRRSLGICSQAFCRVFVCVIIHTKRLSGLDVRYRAIHSVGII
jgi:hypothetical protein